MPPHSRRRRTDQLWCRFSSFCLKKGTIFACPSQADASGSWQAYRITSSAWNSRISSHFQGVSTGRSPGLAPLRAAHTHPLLLLLGLAGLLDLLEHEVAIATEPVRHRHELLPVGLVEPHPAAPFVILRRQREGRQQPAQREGLDPLVAPLYLLACDGQALLLDGQPNAFHHQGRNGDTRVVVGPADIFRHALLLRLIQG